MTVEGIPKPPAKLEMAGEAKKLISFDKSVCISNIELLEESLKEEKSTLAIDEERLTESCELPRGIKSSSFFSSRGGCAKSCTKHENTVAEGYAVPRRC